MVFDHSTGKWFIVKTSTGSIFAIIEFQCFCFFMIDSLQVQNIMSFLNWWNKIRFQNYRYFFGIDIQVNLYFNVVNERVEQKKVASGMDSFCTKSHVSNIKKFWANNNLACRTIANFFLHSNCTPFLCAPFCRIKAQKERKNYFWISHRWISCKTFIMNLSA